MYSALPVYFQNAAVTLYEHPDGYAIFAYQPGMRRLEDFQAALTHLGSLLRRGLLGRGVVHGLRGRAARPAGLVAALVGPAVAAYTAVLLADNVFARLASNQLRQEARLAGITYRLFDHTEADAATAWLGQLTQPPRLTP